MAHFRIALPVLSLQSRNGGGLYTLVPSTASGSSQGAACSVLAHTPFLLQGSEADSSLSW